MKRILVGYDASAAAERALERSAELAKAFDATITVASVAHAYHGFGRGIGVIDPADPPELHRAELHRARRKLDELGAAAETVEAIGDPGKTLAEIAEQRRADLIVVGTHDFGVLDRVIYGSVSDTVKHTAHRDVLIVH